MAGKKKLFSEVLPLREASRLVVRRLGALADVDRSVGLNFVEGHILIETEKRGKLTVAEAAELLSCNKSSASRSLSSLENRGFIKAAGGNEDKRVKPFVLTSSGSRKLSALHAVANKRMQITLTSLSAAEREAVLRGMKLFARALEQGRQAENASRRTGAHLGQLVN